MVWSLLLQDDSEGPTLIDYTVTQNKSSVADSFCSWRTQKLNLRLSWICREVVIVSKIRPAVGFRTPTELFGPVAPVKTAP